MVERILSKMSFSRLYYHFVWATRGREPCLTGDRERAAHSAVRRKAEAEGAFIHAIGGMPDHIHLVISLPPKIAPAAFIGAVKGASSFHLRHHDLDLSGFTWQNEYGVVTFGRERLSSVIRYVQGQAEHHKTESIIDLLEVTTEKISRRAPTS